MDRNAYEMPNILFWFSVHRLAIEEVTKGKKEEFGAKKTGKTKNSKFSHLFLLVSDLDSGSITVSDLDNNSN